MIGRLARRPRAGIGVNQHAGQRGAFVRHFDVLDARPANQPRRFPERFHAAAIRGLARFGLRLHEALADVVVVRRAEEIRGRGQLVAFGGLRVSDVLEPLRFRAPTR